MGQLGPVLSVAAGRVKNSYGGHRKGTADAPWGGLGWLLGFLPSWIPDPSSPPRHMVRARGPSGVFLVHRPPRPAPLPANCNDADFGRAWPGPDYFAPSSSRTAAMAAAMALVGDVARTRRLAPRGFLIASIAAAGLVFGAQAGRAGESTTESATGLAAWAKSNAISVTFDDGRLTLYAPNARLDWVLRRIGAEAGFEVIIRGDLGAPSPYAVMTRVPLARALRRLFEGTSMVILYEPRREDGAERITEVRFYGPRPPAPEARR